MTATRQLSMAMVLVLGIVIGAWATSGTGTPASVTGPGGQDLVLTSALEPFAACDDLLAYFKDEALDRVGPYGLDGGGMVVAETTDAAAAGGDAPAPEAARSSSAPPVEGQNYSGTNNQEAGVDEADIVKTDGRIIATVVQGQLQVIDLDRRSEVASTLTLEGWNHQLLLDGDRLLVVGEGDGGSGGPMPLDGPAPMDVARSGMPGGMHGISTLTLVDLSDPADARIEQTLTLDGSYRAARMVDGTARVVLASGPGGLPFVYPEGSGLRAEREATRRNREVIASSTIESWLPYYVAEDSTGAETEGAALECDAVSRPPEFAGFGIVSVLSVDMSATLTPAGGTGVVAAGETVYASTQNLYVTTNRWYDPADQQATVEDYSTEIHAFDITQPQARYVASGSVRGHVLNQFSLSEHEGYLRVATTEGAPWNGAQTSESYVTILEERGGALARVGQVGDLGRGEQIYAVRFLGDVGYVVTFRQTDPLYTIDLSDPADPRTTGELKILGYSAYLHPVGDGLLLGVGQDANRDGMTTGTQVSLFDVTDPASPQRVDQVTMPGGSSEVEWDHRAFLYWEPSGLVVVPFNRYGVSPQGQEQVTVGARALRVGDGDIRGSGTVEHPVGTNGDPWMLQIRRSMVIGEELVTLSDGGLLFSALEGLAPGSFVRF